MRLQHMCSSAKLYTTKRATSNYTIFFTLWLSYFAPYHNTVFPFVRNSEDNWLNFLWSLSLHDIYRPCYLHNDSLCQVFRCYVRSTILQYNLKYTIPVMKCNIMIMGLTISCTGSSQYPYYWKNKLFSNKSAIALIK